jgi:hypothetical protein
MVSPGFCAHAAPIGAKLCAAIIAPADAVSARALARNDRITVLCNSPDRWERLSSRL